MNSRPFLLKEKIVRLFTKRAHAYKMVLDKKQTVLATIEGQQCVIPYADPSNLYGGINEAASIVADTKNAKTILFSGEQAQVFTKVHRSYVDTLDFKLPFPEVLLQFTCPVKIDYQLRSDRDYDRGSLIAMALSQDEIGRSDFERYVRNSEEHRRKYDLPPNKTINVEFNSDGFTVVNRVCFLYEDWGTEYIGWHSAHTQEFLADEDKVQGEAMAIWQNVAIACIGYVNCENIHLHREGEVAESVNAKRERNGKSRLEPYYVCRIRGVQYDKTDATGTGSAHGIRYDVRGHFRRLTTGKTTWVRPHQRGLANELYVPKVYLVDKKAAA